MSDQLADRVRASAHQTIAKKSSGSDYTPRGISKDAAASQIGVSKTQIERLIAAGTLIGLKVGHRTVVTVASIDSYWASLPRATFQSRAPKKAAA